MPRNRQKFKSDLTKVFTKAAKEAHLASLNTSLNDDETFESMANKIAIAFSNKFVDELLPDFANIIDAYLDSQEFDVKGLTAGGSAVSGILKSI